MEKKELVIGFVNNVQIRVIENGEKLVPIKPICEALNVDYPTQFTRIKEDPILSSVIGLSPTTGKDGKTYEMQCLPIKYVFGWLFRIDARNVKEESKEAVLNYQMKCYDILYDYFTLYMEFVKVRQVAIDKQMEVWEEAKTNFKNTKNVMDSAWNKLKQIRSLSFEEFQQNQAQFELFD